MNLKKRILFKKIRNHSVIKTATTHNIFSPIYIAGKVAHEVINYELFRIWSTKLKRIWLRCTD